MMLILLMQAVTIPSLAMSHIMLEAYKKYILVSLIAYGKVLDFVCQSLNITFVSYVESLVMLIQEAFYFRGFRMFGCSFSIFK